MKSSGKDDDFIQELIKLHFSVITSSENSLEDAIIVKKTVVTIFNEFSLKMTGSEAFNWFDHENTLSNVEPLGALSEEKILLSGALSEEKILLISQQLFQSIDIATELKPMISTFLIQLDIVGICCRLKNSAAHKIIIQSLLDDPLDDNLILMVYQIKEGDIIDFYREIFPEGTKELVKAISDLTENAAALPITSSVNSSFLPSDIDLGEAWEYTEALFSVSSLFDDDDEYIEILREIILSNADTVTVQTVLESNSWLNEYIPYFQQNLIEFLDQDFVTTIQCQESVAGNEDPNSGKKQILFFSEQGICVVNEKSKIRRRPQPIFFRSVDVLQISIGTRNHLLTSGFSSSNTNFLVLTIFTKSHQIHTKNIYLGDSEAQANTTRPAIIKKLNSIADHYTVVEGDVVQSTSGYSIQPSFGIFQQLE